MVPTKEGLALWCFWTVIQYAPARINMVESSSVSKVRSVDGELVVSVQLRLDCVVARPWIATAAL